MITVNNKILEDVIGLSVEAGHEIMKIYDTDFGVDKKSDNSPITEADMAAHHVIVDGLGTLTPKTPVLSEESANIPFEIRSQWKQYWLVDPLDGTREFIKRNGEFTVNIALIDNHESVLGVVYAPVTGALYYAARGVGAYKKSADNELERIRTRKKPARGTIVAGSRSHRGDSLVNFLDRIGGHEIISMGSSLKSCLVAEGSADIYPRLGPTSEWDTAAAQCIVEEAGGRLVLTNMQPMRYNTKESLLNPHFLVVGDPDFDWSQFL
jgi:3'(2'), 5'-bisphosphate nucleotidase